MPISPNEIVLTPNIFRVGAECKCIDSQFKKTDWVLENKQTAVGNKAGLSYWDWVFEQEGLNPIDREEIKNLYKSAGWSDTEIILQPGTDRYSLRLYTDKHIC